MRITKFVHSCILVEDDGKNVLFDPGIFSWQSGLIDVAALPELQAVVVTHKHGDHVAEPFVRALVARFPQVQWFAPSDAHADLQKFGVKSVTNQSSGLVELQEIDHAPVEPFGEQVKNLIVHWNAKLTHPGDTHEIPDSKEILLLPVQSPWGTTVRAMQLAAELQPKVVVPVHDWMWNDDWRTSVYGKFTNFLKEYDIQFISPENGTRFEVDQ